MAELTFTKNNGDFYHVSESGVSAITGSAYARYNDSGTGAWIRVSFTVPSGKKWTISEIYSARVGSSTDAEYGFTKEERTVYSYANNSSFTYTAPKGSYGSSEGSTWTSSDLSITLTAGTWYVYVYVTTKGSAWQYVTTSNTKLKLTYTEESDGGLVYIANGSSFEAYEVWIANGSKFEQYEVYVADGSKFVPCG